MLSYKAKLMKLIIDTDARTLTTLRDDSESTEGLYTKAAYEAISLQWLRIGWSLRCYHNYSWFGSPILQLPEDLVRLQEVIYRIRPDVIVETGVFRGGSVLFHASLCQALGKGRVIGIDREIPPDARRAVESHFLAPRVTLLEGDSISAAVAGRVFSLVQPGESVLVILDSCHTKQHVRCELEMYSRLVTAGSYIIAADGIMKDLADVPGGQPEWIQDNPLAAAVEFAREHPEFVQQQPEWPVRDSELTENVTYWPGAWLRRLA
jgi:cephalosporin hydroxylase